MRTRISIALMIMVLAASCGEYEKLLKSTDYDLKRDKAREYYEAGKYIKSTELIEQFEARWDWSALSWNEALPWSHDLVERYEDRWCWSDRSFGHSLSGNDALPWSVELIERYEGRWDWEIISLRATAFQSLLRHSDIAEIMQHHLAELEVIKTNSAAERREREIDVDVDIDDIPF